MTLPDDTPFSRLWSVVLVILIGFLALVLYPSTRGTGLGGSSKALAKNDAFQLATALEAFHTEYGGFPSGNGPAVLAALRGKNSRALVFLEVDPKSVNTAGEFADPWKSPYRFGVRNDGSAWAYSLGKNKADDGGRQSSDDITSW